MVTSTPALPKPERELTRNGFDGSGNVNGAPAVHVTAGVPSHCPSALVLPHTVFLATSTTTIGA
jgi:hypothetical protein